VKPDKKASSGKQESQQVRMPEGISMTPVADLLPYARNSRTHSPAQIAKLAAAIREFGWTVPILVMADGTVVAGHGRLEAARQLKLEQVPTIDVSHLDEAQMRAYVIADNRLALDAGWDEDLLASEVQQLLADDFAVELLGFSATELGQLLGTEPDEVYTRKVESPVYVPTGPMPALSELYDDTRTRQLLAEIDAAELPEDVKAFLRVAAHRHTVLHFRKVAEYYAHSDETVQGLMESSALVIIDFDQAIERGYVKLTEQVLAQYQAEYGAESQDA